MLHLVTPLFRFENLDTVYRSIPPHDDVVWHVAKTSRRPPLDNPWLTRDPRIRLYEIDCDDADIVTKRNTAFDEIRDGYFFLLDDDTVCVEAMYEVYREYSGAGFVGMIVGANNLSRAVAPSRDPAFNRVDAGSVLCHHAVLDTVRWEWTTRYHRDRYFWSRCFDYFGEARTIVLDRTIAAYNALGPLIRVRKRILSLPLAWDIYNSYLARCYFLAATARHHGRRWLSRLRK
jgi:hypothetical protein